MTTDSTTLPGAADHLPPSLQCRDCQQSLAFMLQDGQVKVYCQVMHLISYDVQEQMIVTNCSRYQRQSQGS